MKKLLTSALALAVLAVCAVSGLAQGWSVAIEQNPMLTNCGNTTNIPVAGATNCTTAKAAAWNLLTTLLQTPNCMSSGCGPGYTISQGVSTCTPDPYTRPNGSAAMRWQVSWTWTCVPPPCCNSQVNLSTGQGNGLQDPLWKVNGNPTYITSLSAWFTAPFTPARWIQKTNSSTAQPVPAGIYKYTVSFVVPTCPAGHAQLSGTFAADNSAKVFLQPGNHPIAITTCLHNCFKAPQAPVALSVPSALLVPGPHTLEIDVTNDGGYSGLIVNAQLARKCP
jgi:hypothetical protein